MAGISNHRLIQHLLVIITSAWLPISTMAVPPCCCSFQRVAVGTCCCPAVDSDDGTAADESHSHSQRRCGCAVKPLLATNPDAVAVVNAVEDISAGLQLQATLPSLDNQLLIAVGIHERIVRPIGARSATGTCVALCRFLC